MTKKHAKTVSVFAAPGDEPEVTGLPDDEPNDVTPTICRPGAHEWEHLTTDWSRCRLCQDRQLTKYLDQ